MHTLEIGRGYAQHNALEIYVCFLKFEFYFILSSNECPGLLGHFIKNKDLISEECKYMYSPKEC